MAIVDADGAIIRLNSAAREQRNLDVGALLSPNGRASAELRALRAELRAHGKADVDLRVVGAAGSARRVSLEGVSQGAQSVLVVRDITDACELAEEVQRLRRIESIGLMAASVVHDFNNLLTPILCVSELLERALVTGSRESDQASEIRGVAERASALVQQLLSVVRGAPSGTERVSMGATIRRLHRLVEHVVGEGVEVTLALEDTDDDVLVERDQLVHVLLNFAANARDAMPRGGTLTLQTSGVVLGDDEARAIEGATAGPHIVVSITDTGVGMTAQVRARIFEQFFTTKALNVGTGIGLAAARRFITQCKGWIAVRSEPGCGTTFALYLPRAEPIARDSAPASHPADLPRGTETILVVEDDAHVRGAVRAALEDQGYRVIEAATREGALRRARAHEGAIDLALVDVVMPDSKDGDSIAHLAASTRGGRVVFMSGHADKVLLDHGVDPTSDTLLRKAFSPGELARRVRLVLDRRSEAPDSIVDSGTQSRAASEEPPPTRRERAAR